MRNGSEAQELDERGRPIHRVSGRRSATIPIDAKYSALWTDAKIDPVKFLEGTNQMAAGILAGVLAGKDLNAIEEADLRQIARISARLADYTYIERMIRERGEVD